MPPLGPWPRLIVATLLALFVPPGGRFAAQAGAQFSEAEHSPEAAESAEDQRNSDPTEGANPSVNEPELLYLMWQANEWNSDGEPIGLAFWRPDGTLVSEELVKVHKAFPADRRYKVHNRREQDALLELHPLVMVFRVDGGLPNASVHATVITEDGQRSGTGSARFSSGLESLALSAAAPSKRKINRWPESISLEVTYPIEDVQTIKTIREMPDEVVQIADGVTWYFDSSRAVETDPRTGRRRHAADKTAAVLQRIRDGSLDLISYGANPFLRASGERLDIAYGAIIEPGGQMHHIDVSEPINDKDEIERIEFTRQRFARARIDNVNLRLDLLPPEEEAAKGDRQIERYR